MNPRFLISIAAAAIGCQTIDQNASFEAGSSELLRQKGTSGAYNGYFDYCDGATLCAIGEGDCDLDTQCEPGLVCVDDIGGNFGLSSTIDVCAPATCEDGSLSGTETAIDFGNECGSTCGFSASLYGNCHPGCECAVGEGDCNADVDCAAGLVCGVNNGAAFGLHWTYDVCVDSLCSNGVLDAGETSIDYGGTCGTSCSGSNGDQEGFCTSGCPCGQGEGDCDSTTECEAGLECVANAGGDWGLDSLTDVCLAAYTISDLVAGDLVVTEMMIDPNIGLESAAEYFELYNNTNNTMNLNGLYIQDAGTAQAFTLTADFFVAPHEYVSFGRTATLATNGGFTPDYDYPNVFSFSNTADRIVLRAGSAGITLDSVIYGLTWLRPIGRSLELSRSQNSSDNSLPQFWCESLTLLPNGDYGSPGAANRICP